MQTVKDRVIRADDEGRRAAAAVDSERLWRRHGDMAAIGAIEGNGVNRQALSIEDIAARRLLIGWAQQFGFEITGDEIGNLFIRRPGIEPELAPVMTGSHMDSQPMGGRFDGMYGVLAGFEALQALEQAGVQTRRSIELVAWTNEEGSRFAPGAMGSMVYCGRHRLEDFLGVADADGTTLEQALAETLQAIPEAAVQHHDRTVAAYVEAHIEQGPQLENAGRSIGVVTGIQGCRWFTVEVYGEAAHAGTTPLAGRRDAVQDALACVAALNRLTRDESDIVRFTVGRFDVTPGSVNSVACHVSFSVDLRHPDGRVLEELGDAIDATCRQAVRGCDVKVTELLNHAPCVFDDRVVDAVERVAGDLGCSHMRMPSGAFHDAQFMNDICATGMVFIPCEKGISHNPAEYAKPDDLAAGARVLVAALVDLANSL
ncbi:MAG: M20 family metallo-hydrolase [Gammaproteobacteria bacterium]